MRAFRNLGKRKKNHLIDKNSDKQQREQQHSPLQHGSNSHHQSLFESTCTVSSSSSHNKSTSTTRSPTSVEERTSLDLHHDDLLKTPSTSTSSSTSSTNKADQIANMVRQQADISDFFRQAALRMMTVLEETLQQQQQTIQKQQQETAAKTQQLCHLIGLMADKHQQLAQSVAQIALEGCLSHDVDDDVDDDSDQQHQARVSTAASKTSSSSSSSTCSNSNSTLQKEPLQLKACIDNNDDDDHHTAATIPDITADSIAPWDPIIPSNTPGSIAQWDDNSAEAAAAATYVNAKANDQHYHEITIEAVVHDDVASLVCLFDQVSGDGDGVCLRDTDGENARTNASAVGSDNDDDEYNSTATNQRDYSHHFCGTGDVATAARERIPSEILLPETFIDLFALMQNIDGDGEDNSNNKLGHEMALQYAMGQLEQQQCISNNSSNDVKNPVNGKGRNGPVRLFL